MNKKLKNILSIQFVNMRLKPETKVGLLFVLIIACVYIYFIFPDDFILGTSSYWMTQTEDVTQYIAGFNAYFSGEWNFPLFKIESINYPIGTRSTFVDIIPLYAFFLKVFIPNSFFPFNPFGYWIGLSFIMSAVASWLLLKNLKLSSWTALLSLTIFLLIFPALTARLGHISLMSHWLILFSFILYIRGFKKPLQLIEWSVLLFITFYINIYLFAMVFSIYLTTIITNWEKLTLNNNFKQLFIPMSILIVSLFVTILPLSDGGISQDTGWGIYSMNLLSPFYGGKFIHFINPEMPGQYEGFNYLGLGVIFLTIYAFFLLHKHDLDFTKKHKYLFLLLLLFSIYALSNHVYLGTNHLFDLNYPKILDPLFNQFRASGRFFWPVGYAITIFAIVATLKYGNKKAYLFLLLALLLQIVDLKDRVKSFHEIAKREKNEKIESALWNKEISTTTNLYFYPKFRCEKKSSSMNSLLPVMLYAAENKKNLNTGYIARYAPKCNDISNEIAHSNIHNSTYIFAKEEFPSKEFLTLYFPNTFNIECNEFNFAYLCREKKLLTETNNSIVLTVNEQNFSSQVGHFNENGIESTYKKGFLIFGPYITLPAGEYSIQLLGNSDQNVNAIFDIVSENGNIKHAEIIIHNENKTSFIADTNIILYNDAVNTEFRVYVDEKTKMSIKTIEIKKKN